MFALIGRFVAFALCAVGLLSIFFGIRIMASVEVEVREIYGMPVALMPLVMKQGFVVFVCGVALGVLCDISKCVSYNSGAQ